MNDDDPTETITDSVARVESKRPSFAEFHEAVQFYELVKSLRRRKINLELNVFPRSEVVVCEQSEAGDHHYIHASSQGRTPLEALSECVQHIGKRDQ